MNIKREQALKLCVSNHIAKQLIRACYKEYQNEEANPVNQSKIKVQEIFPDSPNQPN